MILENESSRRRPVGPQVSFIQHGLHYFPLSPGNPRLDFIPPAETNTIANDRNEDFEAPFSPPEPGLFSSGGGRLVKRLYGLGLLLLVPGASPSDVLKTVAQISFLLH